MRTETLMHARPERAQGSRMPRFSRLAVYHKLLDMGLLPQFDHADLDLSKKVLRACAEGGCTVMEWANRGERSFMVFAELEEFCAEELPQVALGVGSVDDAGTAALYLNLGASFVVGATLNAEVARVCNRRKTAYLPGCGSVTEIALAEELGCEIVKMFPGNSVGGPPFIKAVAGPRPWTSLMPSGGVDLNEESLEQWFGAGAVCVGVGSNLFPKNLLEAKDLAALRGQVARALGMIKKIRRKQD